MSRKRCQLCNNEILDSPPPYLFLKTFWSQETRIEVTIYLCEDCLKQFNIGMWRNLFVTVSRYLP